MRERTRIGLEKEKTSRARFRLTIWRPGHAPAPAVVTLQGGDLDELEGAGHLSLSVPGQVLLLCSLPIERKGKVRQGALARSLPALALSLK